MSRLHPILQHLWKAKEAEGGSAAPMDSVGGWGGGASPASGLRSECPAPTYLHSALVAGALQNLSVMTVITEEECSLSHPGFEPRREFSHATCLHLLPSVGRTLPADRPSLLSAFAHSPGESAEGTSQHPVSSLRFWENVVQERSGPCAGHFLLWLTLSWLVESSFEKKSGR